MYVIKYKTRKNMKGLSEGDDSLTKKFLINIYGNFY